VKACTVAKRPAEHSCQADLQSNRDSRGLSVAHDSVNAIPNTRGADMNWKIELVAIPVSDVDRAKAFYVDQVGFNADHDFQVDENVRFVQLTPPGSACSIVLGTGITTMPPGSQKGVQIVIPDADEARQHLVDNGVAASDVQVMPWGRFVFFSDPDGNEWSLQELPARS
jgi:predicted enzyme related to lactoylglutathione lyase